MVEAVQATQRHKKGCALRVQRKRRKLEEEKRGINKGKRARVQTSEPGVAADPVLCLAAQALSRINSEKLALEGPARALLRML